MVYIDTDVIIHFIVEQYKNRHQIAQEIISDLILNKKFLISFLSLQEMLFVLNKLNIENEIVVRNFNFFKKFAIYDIDENIFNRAIEIAEETSFKNINDAIHTALSEKYCKKLITFNKNDFNNIKNFTNIEIEILDWNILEFILFK